MSHRNPILAVTAALIGLCFTSLVSVAQTPDVIGQWSLVAPLPYFPVHANLLPNGKVMIWPGDGGISGNDPRAWDPVNESVLSLNKPGYDLFCVGHTSLADGTLFLAGGHISNFVGLSRASTYNYLTDTWTSLPDMNAGRWYPTTTVLANGDVLTISGDINTTVGVNTLPQVLDASNGTWRDLTSAQLILDDYPRMFLTPKGKVFNAMPSPTTRYLDTSGTGAWSSVATRVGGYRDYGSAVMYAPGKILVMGGDQPPKNTAEVIDLNQPSPSWRAVASMQYARRQLNATLLPDGKVLVTGGTSSTGFNDPTGHVDAAELWDPVTENWTTLASSSGIPRVYHSTALLLPDGRVFSTGGNGYPDTEIYSPPYLFKGAAPTITSAPSSVTYGESFLVNTPESATISKVTMLRIGAVTHAFNQGQVIADLSFSQTAGGLNVSAPSSANIAPPGYYMLFILNGSGVPSVAKFVKVNAAPGPTVSISAPADGATVAGSSVTISADVSGNAGVLGVQFKLDGANLGAEVTASPYAITWDSTAVADGLHTITAVARDAAGNTTTSAGVNVTVNNTTLLPDLIVSQLSYANGVFTATVTNQGTAATPAGVAIGVGYAVDGIGQTWGAAIGPLAAGASVTIGTDGGAYTIPNGTHGMTAYVDDVNRIVELDEANNQLSLPVTGGITDTQAPTVSLTAPADGATVSGSSVTISADASDNVGIVGVQFLISGTYPGPEVTTAPYAITWDSTAAVDGPHTITAVARDAAGNTTTSAGVNVTVNNTTLLPDVIVTSLSYANGVFTSTVKNQGTAATPAGVAIGVGYAVDGIGQTWGAAVGPLAAGASVTIGTGGGAYTIADGTHSMTAYVDDVNRFAESNEANNQLSQSITVGGTGDTQAPIVSLTAPADGATVSGSSVTISAAAADNVGVVGVQFKLNGANLGVEDTTAPYSATWDSTAVSNGLFTITAVARDAAGNTATSAGANVTVNNTTPPSNPLPDVIVTSLSYANGVFTSTVMNQGTAAIPAGAVIGVGYAVDGIGRTWGSVVGPLAAGASVTIGTDGGVYTIADGIHSMTAYVDDVNRFAESDESNNQLSQSITVGGTGDTQAPIVSLTAPADGATVSASVAISGDASDNVGVVGVQFKLNGANLGGEDTTAPYAATWDSTAVSNGLFTITAVARDAAGNTTTSAGVNVTVNNTTPPSNPLPDVIVTSLSYANGVFTSTVMNQGTAATPAGVVIGVGYAVDGIGQTWGAVVGPLAAGASATIGTDGGAYTIPSGTHGMTAYVDDVNRFAEANETNNQLSQPITVP